MSAASIDEITVLLKNMKESGKVDQSVVDKLGRLANLFKEYQERWLTSRNTRVSIFFYYAARNAALVVSRMKERFLSTNKDSVDAKMAEDLLQVIALIRELLDLTVNEKPDESVTKLIIEKVKQLRATATNAVLVQAQEKELEDVDKLLSYLSKLRK